MAREIKAYEIREKRFLRQYFYIDPSNCNTVAPIRYNLGVLSVEISPENRRYAVKEPEIDDNLRKVLNEAGNVIRSSATKIRSMDDFNSILSDVFRRNRIDSSAETIRYTMAKEYSEFGNVYPLTLDPSITEIICNGYGDQIIVRHEEYGYLSTGIILSRSDADSIVIKLAQNMGRSISLDSPVASGYHISGYFVQLTFGSDISSKGSTFDLKRDFASGRIVMLSRPIPEKIGIYFSRLVSTRRSAIVIGGGCPNKQRILKVILDFIPSTMKVVLISESQEYYGSGGNRLVMSPQEETIFNRMISREMLVETAMRQRPDYIFIDRLSEGSIDSLIQSIMTGHATYSTMNADDLRTYVSKLSEGRNGITRNMIGAVDAVIKFSCESDAVTEIYEYESYENDQVNYNKVFHYDQYSGKYIYSGYSRIMPPGTEGVMQEYGRSLLIPGQYKGGDGNRR